MSIEIKCPEFNHSLNFNCEYICLDKNCKNNRFFCGFCLFNNHKDHLKSLIYIPNLM